MDRLISLQAAIDAIRNMQTYKMFEGDDTLLVDKAEVQTELRMLPSAHPEPQWIPCRDRVIEKLRDYIVNDDAYDMDENVQGFNDGIQTAITVLSTFEP